MINNILKNIPDQLPEEITEILLDNKIIRIEKIISKGQSSPKDFWYDQDENEWVIVIQGQASLIFENKTEVVKLTRGDFINIPAHLKHRIHWTDPNDATIWLAIFY